jgi:hypothetical protein
VQAVLVARNTVVEATNGLGSFLDNTYKGKNIFGEKLYKRVDGGAPEAFKMIGTSGISLVGRIKSISNLVRAGLTLEEQSAMIWANRRLFLNWLKANHSLTRIARPLNATEAQLVIDNARRLGITIEHNLNGLQGLEVTGQWARIPHFKIGDVHIPIERGLETILQF